MVTTAVLLLSLAADPACDRRAIDLRSQASLAAAAEAFDKLDAKYPLTANPARPGALTDGQLTRYFLARIEAVTVYLAWEARRDAARAKGGDACEVYEQMPAVVRELRETLARTLEAQKMSPREFEALTQVIFGGGPETKRPPELKKFEAQARSTASPSFDILSARSPVR